MHQYLTKPWNWTGDHRPDSQVDEIMICSLEDEHPETSNDKNKFSIVFPENWPSGRSDYQPGPSGPRCCGWFMILWYHTMLEYELRNTLVFKCKFLWFCINICTAMNITSHASTHTDLLTSNIESSIDCHGESQPQWIPRSRGRKRPAGPGGYWGDASPPRM